MYCGFFLAYAGHTPASAHTHTHARTQHTTGFAGRVSVCVCRASGLGVCCASSQSWCTITVRCTVTSLAHMQGLASCLFVRVWLFEVVMFPAAGAAVKCTSCCCLKQLIVCTAGTAAVCCLRVMCLCPSLLVPSTCWLGAAGGGHVERQRHPVVGPARVHNPLAFACRGRSEHYPSPYP